LLLFDAPICQGLLDKQLGYLADTETTQQMLDGRFELTPDIDDATGIMLEEIARIGAQLTNGEIIIEITPDDFRKYWTGDGRRKLHHPRFRVSTLAITRQRVILTSSRDSFPRKYLSSPNAAARHLDGV
jgi:hypothetical protein